MEIYGRRVNFVCNVSYQEVVDPHQVLGYPQEGVALMLAKHSTYLQPLKESSRALHRPFTFISLVTSLMRASTLAQYSSASMIIFTNHIIFSIDDYVE